jgi:competence protein ComEC
MLDRLKNVSLNASRKLAARPGILIFIPLGIAASLTALAASSLPDDDLHVSFLSVESGQAVVIQAGHQTVLIDGGENPQTLCEELGRSLPFWQRDIDLMLLTDPHLEHVNGLIEVLKRYRVKQAIAPMTGYSSAAYGEWRRLIREKEVDLTLARTGQSIRLQSGSTIDVLFAPFWFSAANKEEESSVILKLTRGQVSFLLVSDASPETQKGLAAQNAALDCTILAVPHRGEAGSLTTDLLASAQPQAAVITSKNGVPDPDALQALTDALGPERTYRTGKAGTVEFVTDGQTLRVKTAR